MSYAQFEMSAVSGEGGSIELARRVYERANQALRGAHEKEERVLLLEAWRDFEERHSDEKSVASVQARMPRRVKRRQRVQADDGVSSLTDLHKCSKYINKFFSCAFKCIFVPSLFACVSIYEKIRQHSCFI